MTNAIDAIYTPHRPARRVAEKTALYDIAAETVGPRITYLEFGVFQGRSMREMLARFTDPDSRFYGFDSFAGLPEAWGGHDAGHFATNAPRLTDSRVALVQGYFQNTVPSFLASTQIGAPALIHYDADLYSSTLFLLSTLWHHIPAHHFIFDDFIKDESRALRDFASAYPVEIEFLAERSNPAGRPAQVFGRMQRTEFRL